MFLEEKKDLLFEFFRYILIGGSSFVIDFLTMIVFNEFVFRGEHLYISVFMGYMLGLIFNFVLSCSYVFKNGFQKIKNKEFQCFMIFVIIGTIGLGFTEVLMYFFVSLLSVNYLLSKAITSIIVLFWNYIARKVIIFK